MLRSRLLGLVLASLPAVGAGSEADGHLRAGAAHFRAERFAEAVVEFKVARELGAGGECPWYIASALTRAGRSLEALEAFEQAEQEAASSSDALFLYYRGVACAEQQLLVCAEAAFTRASSASGPRVAEQARRLAAEVRGVLSTEPPRSAIDALLGRAAREQERGRPRLARLFAQEASALAAIRADLRRGSEAAHPADGGTVTR